MSLTHVLDTNVLIDVQRNHLEARQWANSVDPSTIGVPGYVAMELIQDARNRAEAAAAAFFTNRFTIAWPNDHFRDWALVEFTDQHLAHGIGLVDMLIAATALSHSATLYTFNLKHYRNVPGLMIEQPYQK